MEEGKGKQRRETAGVGSHTHTTPRTRIMRDSQLFIQITVMKITKIIKYTKIIKQLAK